MIAHRSGQWVGASGGKRGATSPDSPDAPLRETPSTRIVLGSTNGKAFGNAIGYDRQRSRRMRGTIGS
ncbi:MAG: hypothetical protein ABI573_08665 [Chloroflexota bacterium]